MNEAVGVCDVAELRRRRNEQPLYPYEALHSADNWHAGKRQVADAILSGDWCWKGHPSVALQAALDWDRICAESRSWNLALHSWEPLAPLIAGYDQTGDAQCLDFALTLAADWIEQFPAIHESPGTFAWYDVAVGSRAYRLAYILDVVLRDTHRGDDIVQHLLGGLLLHGEALADETRFARHSNHGIYQVMGQLAMSRRFPDVPLLAAAGAQGKARLDEMLETHFTAEGVHREHSPHYHSLILIPLRALRAAGLVQDKRLKVVCGKCEESLAWFVTPAGRYAMFGDTPRQTITGQNVGGLESNHLRFALSAGRTGTPPSATTKGFGESGYVIFRDRWPKDESGFADCSYLAQTCAFHSRVHKHADDLSFVWYDRSCDIFTDAGRFGYVGKTEPDSALFARGFWYSDPQRIYVESTRAHNTVEIDGRSNPRRGVEPYGSALTQWGERGAIRFAESQVQRGTLLHTRLLLFLPRFWLVVVDSLVEGEDERHEFIQRFHLAPELELVEMKQATQHSLAARLPTGDLLHAVALLPSQVPVQPVRGAKEPELLGWMSPRDGVMEPQWTLGWSASAVQAFVFASLFCFAEQSPSAELGYNRVDAKVTSAQLGWMVDERRHLVEVERHPGQAFSIDYSTTARTDDS